MTCSRSTARSPSSPAARPAGPPVRGDAGAAGPLSRCSTSSAGGRPARVARCGRTSLIARRRRDRSGGRRSRDRRSRRAVRRADHPRQQRRPGLVAGRRRRSRPARSRTIPKSAWDAMIDSHLKSALFVSQAFIAAVPRARGAAPTAASSTSRRPTASCRPISRSTSIGARGGATYFKPVGYSVAKSGVLNFTRWLAEYGAPLGIRVNTLVPGGVRRPATRRSSSPSTRSARRSAAWPTRRRLQRRRAVPRLARLGLHDRRHARRRRRLDGAMNGAESESDEFEDSRTQMGEKDHSDRALAGDDALSYVPREAIRAVRERRSPIRSRARRCSPTSAASTRCT